jgi:Domain of unknown function (DUF4136)
MSFETISRSGSIRASLLAAGVVLYGCAATINHTYDPVASFAGLRSYDWATTGTLGPTHYQWNDSTLVVKNVQYDADQVLEKKGFTKTTEKPDFLITISYDYETGINQYGYELRMLTLQVHKADNKQLLWQGSATSKIKADSASGNLRKAVEDILASFPPKK